MLPAMAVKTNRLFGVHLQLVRFGSPVPGSNHSARVAQVFPDAWLLRALGRALIPAPGERATTLTSTKKPPHKLPPVAYYPCQRVRPHLEVNHDGLRPLPRLP